MRIEAFEFSWKFNSICHWKQSAEKQHLISSFNARKITILLENAASIISALKRVVQLCTLVSSISQFSYGTKVF